MPSYLAPDLKFISCAGNPLDLRPARDLIVADVLRRRAAMPENQPLVLLMSEVHSMSTHVALRQMVISMLRETAPCALAVGYEGDHDILEKRILKNLKPELNLPDMQKIDFVDRKGRCLLLGLILSGNITTYAPQTHINFFAFCHRNRIAFRFNDAAAASCSLDFSDPATNSAYRSFPLSVRWKFSFFLSNRNEMAIRNNVIATRALAHAAEMNAAIYIQHCGLHHVFGARSQGLEFKNSLTAYFKASGARVCSPFITSPYFNTLIVPVEAQSALQNNLVFNGIHPETFSKEDNDFNAEQEFQHLIHTATGGEYEILPVDKEKMRRDFDIAIKNCLNDPDLHNPIPIPALTVS